jgi:nucleoside 2-deoxyribosyltransferase
MNGHAISTLTPDGLKSVIPGNALVVRDLKCVEHSDLVIANLNTWGEKRAPTGTICEVAIAGYTNKPLIVITDDYNYREHPFIVEFASIIVPTVEELLEKKFIDYFYKGKVTAKYD